MTNATGAHPRPDVLPPATDADALVRLAQGIDRDLARLALTARLDASAEAPTPPRLAGAPAADPAVRALWAEAEAHWVARAGFSVAEARDAIAAAVAADPRSPLAVLTEMVACHRLLDALEPAAAVPGASDGAAHQIAAPTRAAASDLLGTAHA